MRQTAPAIVAASGLGSTHAPGSRGEEDSPFERAAKMLLRTGD